MKELLLVVVISIFFFQTSLAQVINLELVDPHPELQAADVGDMEFADIDNDGDNDLIISGKGGPILTTIYVNDGNGNFTESANTQLVKSFSCKVGLNDIDDDGDLDLLITGQSLSVAATNLYLNDGTGIFTPISTSIANAEGGDFEFGDIDDDGDDDLILTSWGDSGNHFSKLYLNDGTGDFSEMVSASLEGLGGAAVEFFDYDGDDDLDLIMSGINNNDESLTILYANDGSGNFSEVSNTGLTSMSGGDIAIGDSDGDGDLDILICGEVANVGIRTEMYLNDGTGIFSLLQNTGFSDVSIGEVSFNDFNNDGKLDVFLLGSGDGGLLTNAIVGNIYENLGDNNFIISDSLFGAYLSSHSVADIDGDNDLDLVLSGTTTGSPTRATWLYTNLTPITVDTKDLTQDDNSSFKVYPNPFNDILNINHKGESEASIQIYSATGNLVYSDVIQRNVTQISMDLPVGIYTVLIRNSETYQSQKIISIK